MPRDSFEIWEKLLNPDKLKQGLVQASLYLAAYEILRHGVVDRIKDFFRSKWQTDDETGEIKGVTGPDYKTRVLHLHPNDEFHACCLWLASHQAIDERDLDDIGKTRRHRNRIAHGLHKHIGRADHAVDGSLLRRLIDLARKMDVWWVREVEIATDPDLSATDIDSIDWEQTAGASTLVLELVLSIFDGDDSFLRSFYPQFVAAWRERQGE